MDVGKGREQDAEALPGARLDTHKCELNLAPTLKQSMRPTDFPLAPRGKLLDNVTRTTMQWCKSLPLA